MKKILSGLLSLIMVFSVLPVSIPVNAADSGNQAEVSYYLTGDFNRWDIVEENIMTRTDCKDAEEYAIINVDLQAGTAIKIAGKQNDGFLWYPSGMAGGAQIKENGVYSIYFRPQSDKDDRWMDGHILVHLQDKVIAKTEIARMKKLGLLEQSPTEPPTDEPELEPPTEGPATEPPTDEPELEPPTEGPATEPPTDEPELESPTEGPATEPPTDEPELEPPTEGPATEPPTDEPEPPTEGPATEPPTDEPEPPTEGPATDPPTDEPEPPTEGPATEPPTEGSATEPATEAAQPATGYYVLGSMNDWEPVPTTLMHREINDYGQEVYTIDMILQPADAFKVVYCRNGISELWYPEGMGNSYGENGEITQSGTYTIRFMPDGAPGWFGGYIDVVPYGEIETEPPTEEATTEPPLRIDYSLVGTFNDWWINKEEYRMSSDLNVLENSEVFVIRNVNMPADSRFKVVGSTDYDNNWYPDNDIYVEESGIYNVYFSPTYSGGYDWLGGGCILMEKVADYTEKPVIIADGICYEAKQDSVYEYTYYIKLNEKLTAVDASLLVGGDYGIEPIEYSWPRLGDNVYYSQSGNETIYNYASPTGVMFSEKKGYALVSFRFRVFANNGVLTIDNRIRNLATYPEEKVIYNSIAVKEVDRYSTVTVIEEAPDPCAHEYGEWIIDEEPSCDHEGARYRECVLCGEKEYDSLPTIPHTYKITHIEPTYHNHGYTLYECSVCGYSYTDDYVDPLERIDIAEAELSLEYSEAYYEGQYLTPAVILRYNGEVLDPSAELNISYYDNNKVGTARVRVEGINRFSGTRELTFRISYEHIPQKIVGVNAVGETEQISLSWGKSAEVTTESYRIYRKADADDDYVKIGEIHGRDNLIFEDAEAECGVEYSYYVTGVGLYGAESEPSTVVRATAHSDIEPPQVFKMTPSSGEVIYSEVRFSVSAVDNIGVDRVEYAYSLDNENTWIPMGVGYPDSFYTSFNVSTLDGDAVKVRAIAFDRRGNESAPYKSVYSLDNTGPDKVTGLKADPLSSRITLSWDDVSANDAAYFVLQSETDGVWKTIASHITQKGYIITDLEPDTEYTYRVACVDLHNNRGEFSDPITVKTSSDVTPPVITRISPYPDRFSSEIGFSATAKDDCDIRTISIQLSRNAEDWTQISSKEYTSRESSRTYNYTIDLSGLDEGGVYVRAIATDFAGNVSDTSVSAPYNEYFIDKTAPSAPVNLTAEESDGYIGLSWDIGSEEDLGYYSLYRSLSEESGFECIASGINTRNYYDRDVKRDTVYYYKIRVSDKCGNLSAFSDVVSAQMAADTQKPVISGFSSTYMQRISPSVKTVRVTATDNNTLDSLVVEYCTSDDAEYQELLSKNQINSYYYTADVDLPIEELRHGDTIFLRAYAVDSAGLVSDYAVTKFTVDRIPPAAKDFSATPDTGKVYLSWSDCGDDDLAGFSVYRATDGEHFNLLGSRGANSDGNYTFVDTITEKESMIIIYKLVAIDKVGNTASWMAEAEYTYVYVNKAPVPSMNSVNTFTVGVEEMFDASASSDDIVISQYLWDFGDGTTSDLMRTAKSFSAPGKYTVTLSVTDNEGITSTLSKEITVVERDLLGTLVINVNDDQSGRIPYAPVYIDLGSENQRVLYANAYGELSLNLVSGTHTIGMYAQGYLPVKKDVVVLSNATRTVTLKTVKEDIVTGYFEVTRMTFDEIVAAKVDVTDPANQNVYSATVRVQYGAQSKPMNINYIRNDDNVIDYTVTDSEGREINQYEDSNGETRRIDSVIYIPVGGGGGGGAASSNAEVVAIVDIPAKAAYLKEFFDVRLHIMNNSSAEFSLDMNEIHLNVPEGMTLMSDISGSYYSSENVRIDSIRGQETVSLAWVLRGDKAGDYNLSADYSGTLSLFNTLVTARFETSEPIKVYGMDGVKFRILACDEIYNDTLYFNVELENQRDVDILMPTIDLTEKIHNVTESVLNNNPDKDFEKEAYLMNVCVVNDNGACQYIPFCYDGNDRVVTNLEVLAPGQKLVFEYVAYNAVNIDGVGAFLNASVTEFEGDFNNIETGSFHKELYSFNDFTKKLEKILSRTDPELNDAYDYIMDDDNFYYVSEAENMMTNAGMHLIGGLVLAGDADVTVVTKDKKREAAENVILSVLTDSANTKLADELMLVKYYGYIDDYISAVKVNLINQYESGNIFSDEVDGSYIDDVFDEIKEDEIDLLLTYFQKGEDEFLKKLQQTLIGYGIGTGINLLVEDKSFLQNKLKVVNTFVSDVCKAFSATERDAYIRAVLQLDCNAEYCEYMLNAIIDNTDDDTILSVALDFKNSLHTKCSEFKAQTLDFMKNLAIVGIEEISKIALKKAVEYAFSSAPAALVVLKLGVKAFNFGTFYHTEEAFDVYNQLSKTFKAAFLKKAGTAADEDEKLYAACLLKAECDMRLKGEDLYKSFLNECMKGTYLIRFPESVILNTIEYAMNKPYSSFDAWCDDVQLNIVSARDKLFNKEMTSFNVPSAPNVVLDYDLLQTVQSFTDEYEYCFGDGIWKTCENKPIGFILKEVPSVLRVRKAASFSNLAGEITTVKIFKQKQLSKQIAASFDGISYSITNLSSAYNYQIRFMNSVEENVDWTDAVTVSGSDLPVKLSGIEEYNYIAIRSCPNYDRLEAFSVKSVLTVAKKKPLSLFIDGSGTVTQSSSSGCYFVGDTVDLNAVPNNANEFVGWYINGNLVSTNEHYMAEMSESLEITAKFSGAKIKKISLDALPSKLDYLEGEPLDTAGLKVRVTYTDDSFEYANQYTVVLSSCRVGKRTVVIEYSGYTASYDVNIRHNESEWVVTEKPSLFNEGLRVKRCPICHNVTESEILPQLKDERGIEIDIEHKQICHIPDDLYSADAIKTYFKEKGYKVAVLNADNTISDTVKTGGYIVSLGNNYVAIIYGDTTGDGEVDIFDILSILDHVNGTSELEGVYKEAGMVANNEDEDIDIFDALTVLDYINGTGVLNQ